MSTVHPRRALDLAEVMRRHELRTGLRTGFPSAADRARFQHLVRIDGLTRDRLGDAGFEAALHAARAAAVRVAPRAFIAEPIRDGKHVVTGYAFAFDHESTAAAFSYAALTALNGRAAA